MDTAIAIEGEVEVLELDELLEESLTSAKGKPAASGMDELDDLLSESMALKEEEAAIKFLREKRKRGGISAAELAEDEARIREWEAKREWDTKFNLGVFEVRECSCGNTEILFSHLMHHQQHKEKKIERSVRAYEQVATLPNRIALQHVKIECCTKCAAIKGWDLTQPAHASWAL